MTVRIHPATSVVEAAREIRHQGLTASSLGNVSVRAGDDIWITPTKVYADDLRPGDLVLLGADGAVRSSGTPSRETPMHLAIYRADPSAQAVVHTHSPWATAWSHRRRDLDLPTEELIYHGLRRIPCSTRAPAGSERLARAAATAVAEAGVALLAGHGVVAVGGSLRVALERATLAEQQAHVQWLVRLDALGAPSRDLTQR